MKAAFVGLGVMGGRMAEMLVFNQLNSGAANDLEQATNIGLRRPPLA